MSTTINRCPDCLYAFGHAPDCPRAVPVGGTPAPAATAIADPAAMPVVPPSPAPLPASEQLAQAVQQAERVAATILGTARDTVVNQRQNQHGDAEMSFQMIADLWKVLMKHRGQELGPADVAFMMTLLKIARATYGNAFNPDHYVDGAGYLALAAELNGAKF